jgi:hypothetical protein
MIRGGRVFRLLILGRIKWAGALHLALGYLIHIVCIIGVDLLSYVEIIV